MSLDETGAMLREIQMQPAFVRDNVDPMFAQAAEACARAPLGSLGGGFTIGCGDSFFAALAARSYMMAQTQRWIEPVEALEFSRYLVASLPQHSFVFGISNSGTVARTIEGIRRARECGAWTFALTAAADSSLATTAHTLIAVNAIPNIKQQPDGTTLVTPGTLTYTASLLGLVVASVALGQRLGRSAPDAQTSLVELRALAQWMAIADEQVADPVRELARSLRPDRTMVIVGGGPNFATAVYGAAKWYEALQWPAHYAGLEEWAHEQYFITGPGTDTIVIVPPGASYDRGLEQLQAARDIGARTIALGALHDDRLRASCDVFIGLPDGIPEALTPFVYKLPLEYLACYLAQAHATRFFGFDDPQRQQVNFRQIFDSGQRSATSPAATP